GWAVGGGVFTMLSSSDLAKPSGSTISCSPILAVKAPLARASAAALAARALSSGVSPWAGTGARSLKIRGEETMAALDGSASGTLMTSIRDSAALGSLSGARLEQPASSVGERTGAEPEM